MQHNWLQYFHKYGNRNITTTGAFHKMYMWPSPFYRGFHSKTHFTDYTDCVRECTWSASLSTDSVFFLLTQTCRRSNNAAHIIREIFAKLHCPTRRYLHLSSFFIVPLRLQQILEVHNANGCGSYVSGNRQCMFLFAKANNVFLKLFEIGEISITVVWNNFYPFRRIFYCIHCFKLKLKYTQDISFDLIFWRTCKHGLKRRTYVLIYERYYELSVFF